MLQMVPSRTEIDCSASHVSYVLSVVEGIVGSVNSVLGVAVLEISMGLGGPHSVRLRMILCL